MYRFNIFDVYNTFKEMGKLPEEFDVIQQPDEADWNKFKYTIDGGHSEKRLTWKDLGNILDRKQAMMFKSQRPSSLNGLGISIEDLQKPEEKLYTIEKDASRMKKSLSRIVGANIASIDKDGNVKIVLYGLTENSSGDGPFERIIPETHPEY